MNLQTTERKKKRVRACLGEGSMQPKESTETKGHAPG